MNHETNDGGYLTLPRIEKKPKPVYQNNFQDFARISKNPDLIEQLYEIILSIENGDGVPEEYYRSGIDRDYDELLELKGVMHLHLGGKNSDVLVYLIQCPDKVILLETNTHKHLQSTPKGRNILAFLQPWLSQILNPSPKK